MPANRITTIGRAAVLLFLAGGIVFAQSSEAPMGRSAEKPSAAVPSSAPSTAQHTGQHAKIVYLNGQLEITANNSSLNQILRDISLQTGMKIIGSVADEPVYGKYGPDTPAKILASLLDGTSSNMLLTATTSDAPAELILTPRQGAPALSTLTPAITSTQLAPQAPRPAGFISAPTVQPAAASSTTPGLSTQSTGTSDQASPSADRTQQQVFEHLQQLRALQHNPH